MIEYTHGIGTNDKTFDTNWSKLRVDWSLFMSKARWRGTDVSMVRGWRADTGRPKLILRTNPQSGWSLERHPDFSCHQSMKSQTRALLESYLKEGQWRGAKLEPLGTLPILIPGLPVVRYVWITCSFIEYVFVREFRRNVVDVYSSATEPFLIIR